MQLIPSEEQAQVAEAVADMVRAETPFERWFSAEADMIEEESRLLRFGAEMGWLGFGAPEHLGGSGAGLAEEVLVIRELGARLCPIGVLASATALRVALENGEEQLASEIITGEKRVAICLDPAPGILMGATGATLALGIHDTGLSLQAIELAGPIDLGWDGMTAFARLDKPVSVVEGLAGGADSFAFFRIGCAAMLQGVARTAVEQSNEYAKMREQFGRAIGSFQAVRHRIADMEMASRRAEAAIYFAAVAMQEKREDLEVQLSSALYLSLEAAVSNSKTNIANHGAIGATMENVAHLLLKRALLLRSLGGQSEALLDKVADASAAIL